MFIVDPAPPNTITIFEALETRKILHGSFEFAAWGFLIILNFITGRYFKEGWKWAPFIHWVTGALIFILNVGGFLLMFLLYQVLHNHLHGIIGTATTILVII